MTFIENARTAIATVRVRTGTYPITTGVLVGFLIGLATRWVW